MFTYYALCLLVVVNGVKNANYGRVQSRLLSDILNPPRVTPEPATEAWTGRVLGLEPPVTDPPAKSVYIQHGGVRMGIVDPSCDNAKDNLTVDWDSSPFDYLCLSTNFLLPDNGIRPILETMLVPKYYSAVHHCMNKTLTYPEPLPTFGPHRPLWPRYGEYTYLPVQRWLHSLEHGAVVMLYHPCAHPLEVELLRNLVRGCLWRHIIAANMHVPIERPLALLTWGKRLTMSYVNEDVVKGFIMENALQGPEKLSRNGNYKLGLIKNAKTVSDARDTDLCPERNFQ